MSLTNVTPSTGKQTAVSINLNRLRLRPRDCVVYWSAAAGAVKMDTIDAHASQDGNWFTIDGERLIVTAIWARIPDTFSEGDRAAVMADFASFGRGTLTIFEIMGVCDRHGLDV